LKDVDVSTRLLFTAALISLVSVAGATAQSLDEHLDSWRESHSVQGVAVAIVGPEYSAVAVSGVRNEAGAPIETSDRFSVASVSKTFTAAAITSLIEAGQIRASDSAAILSHLPIAADISVADLLRHESGLPEYLGGALDFGYFLAQNAEGREAWSGEEIQTYASAATASEDRSFAYSNSNYVVLGAILEHQTGLALGDALDQLVFAPNDLDSVALMGPNTPSPEALGRSDMLEGIIGTPYLDARLNRQLATAGNAAGGIAINISDLAHWGQTWFSQSHTYTAPAGDTAFGLEADRIFVGPGGYEISYETRIARVHGGDGLGLSALLLHDIASSTTIAIAINDDRVRSLGFGADGFLDSLAFELLDAPRGD
jgi:CubicO group peptidase (beta-lactamase class C family)